MAITQSEALRNAQADEVSPLLDAGGGGDLVLLTAGDVVVATLPLSATAFAAAVGGVITANTIDPDNNAVGGTVALFELRDNAATAHVDGTVTVTGGGGDIEITSVAIGNGSTVEATSLTYAPAP